MNTFESFINWVLVVGVAFIMFHIIFLVAAPLVRSEDRQAEIDVQAEQEQAALLQTHEDESIERFSEIVGGLYYVQDSRVDDLCFAVRSVYREGYLSVVDCAKIPASMLHVTRTTEE